MILTRRAMSYRLAKFGIGPRHLESFQAGRRADSQLPTHHGAVFDRPFYGHQHFTAHHDATPR